MKCKPARRERSCWTMGRVHTRAPGTATGLHTVSQSTAHTVPMPRDFSSGSLTLPCFTSLSLSLSLPLFLFALRLSSFLFFNSLSLAPDGRFRLRVVAVWRARVPCRASENSASAHTRSPFGVHGRQQTTRATERETTTSDTRTGRYGIDKWACGEREREKVRAGERASERARAARGGAAYDGVKSRRDSLSPLLAGTHSP